MALALPYFHFESMVIASVPEQNAQQTGISLNFSYHLLFLHHLILKAHALAHAAEFCLGIEVRTEIRQWFSEFHWACKSLTKSLKAGARLELCV